MLVSLPFPCVQVIPRCCPSLVWVYSSVEEGLAMSTEQDPSSPSICSPLAHYKCARPTHRTTTRAVSDSRPPRLSLFRPLSVCVSAASLSLRCVLVFSVCPCEGQPFFSAGGLIPSHPTPSPHEATRTTSVVSSHSAGGIVGENVPGLPVASAWLVPLVLVGVPSATATATATVLLLLNQHGLGRESALTTKRRGMGNARIHAARSGQFAGANARR
jgi:hypothetical protein